MSDFWDEVGGGALDEALDATSDYESAAIEDYEAGGDPAVIAQTLRERVGATHEARFVDYWRRSEAVEPEPMTAAEYAQQRAIQQRAAVVAGEAMRQAEAQRQQQAAAAAHEAMLAGEVEAFQKRSPHLEKVAGSVQEIVGQVAAPQTAEQARALLDVAYLSAIELQKAKKAAQIEHEQWGAPDWDASAALQDNWMGATPEPRPTLQQLEAKYTAAALERKRIDGSLRVVPHDNVRATIEEWDADEAPYRAFDQDVDRAYAAGAFKSGETVAARHERLTGQKLAIPAGSSTRSTVWADEGTVEHARETMLQDGWNV